MKVIVIKTDNSIAVKELNKNNVVRDMRDIVRGWVEVVRPRIAYQNKLMTPGTIFCCDEDGQMNQKEPNLIGSILYNGSFPPVDYVIVGDIFIAGETQEDIRGLKDNEISRYLDILATLKETSLEYVKQCQE